MKDNRRKELEKIANNKPSSLEKRLKITKPKSRGKK